MVLKRPRSEFGLNVLIVVGVALVLASVLLHWALPERFEKVEIVPVIIGMTLALFAASWKDPNKAKRAAGIVTGTGREVAHVYNEVRTGERKDDPVIGVETRITEKKPAAAEGAENPELPKEE